MLLDGEEEDKIFRTEWQQVYSEFSVLFISFPKYLCSMSFTNILAWPYFGAIQYPLKSPSLPWRRDHFCLPLKLEDNPLSDVRD